MKKMILVAVTCLLCSSVMLGQTINENYADGKIYFKIKNDVPLSMGLKDDPMNIDFHNYSFTNSIANQFRVKKISRPFHAAKGSSILQQTFELELVNYQDVENVIRQLQASPMIEYAEKVPLDRITAAPNDPSYSAQWELTKIGALGAWAYTTGSAAITVAIVDQGVELTHQDLAANIWVNAGEIANNGIDDDNNGYIDDVNGYDVADNDNNPNPTNSGGHGTEVAGMASARSNNNIGIASIGYSIKIMAVKCSNTTSGSISAGYSGVVYAAAAGARIINCSFGGNAISTTAQNVIDYAYGQGCLIIASAGNAGNSTPQYPGAYTNVIAVASTGSGDVKSSFSSYGSYVDVSAPGANVYTTKVGNGYGYVNGTSFSSPMVAGLCGLMLSLNPTLSNTDIETCLKNNTDNIDGINSSYIGQLGTGRINAMKSMQCIAATLLLKPVADFSANITTVSAGGKVTFTDESMYNPTSWTWTFPGGTPGSYIGKTPPLITYSTAGTYNVILTATNANGTDTKNKTGYIVVSAAVGCELVNYSKVTTAPKWTGAIYVVDIAQPYDSGYVIGVNAIDAVKQKAQYFDATTSPYNKLSYILLYVYKAYSANPNKIVTFNVYDGSSGTPGALLGSGTKTVQQCMNASKANKYLDVKFRPVISLPASKKFFIGVDLSNLSWTSSVKDTFLILTNSHGETTPSGIWEQKANNTWIQMGTSGAFWGLLISMYMFPALTDQPVIATSTVNPLTICEGSSVTMDATGSTFQDTLLWYTPGGAPVISNNVSQSIIYNTAGTYPAKLYVVGGGCREVDSTTTTITVKPTPIININSSNGVTLCPGGSTVLTATGSGSYTWTPSTGLNTTSGGTVTATPTVQTNYNVSGTTAGCIGTSAIDIKVDKPIVVSVVTTPTNATACKLVPIAFDASASANIVTYNWSFPGGSPSTSNSISPSVTYAASGTYTVTLSATNSCGTDNSYSKTVSINICTGINELFSSSNINTSYNSLYRHLDIAIYDNFNMHDDIAVKIIDLLGQVVYSNQLSLTGDHTSAVVDMTPYSSGVYTVQLSGKVGTYNHKFIAE